MILACMALVLRLLFPAAYVNICLNSPSYHHTCESVHGSCRPEKHSNQPTWRWLPSSLKFKWCENRIAAANEPCLLLPSGAKQGLWTHLSNVGAPFWGTLRSLEHPRAHSHWGRDPVKTSSLYTFGWKLRMQPQTVQRARWAFHMCISVRCLVVPGNKGLNAAVGLSEKVRTQHIHLWKVIR